MCVFFSYNALSFTSGGWLLVSNSTMESSSPPSHLQVKTSYRGITSDQMVLTKTAMNELRTHLSFTLLRFYCSKNNGHTIHLTTAANSIGEAVVQYFTGQTDVQPASCGSYVRMENDNSYLGGDCKKWKNGIMQKKTDSTIMWLMFMALVVGCFLHPQYMNAMTFLLELPLVISGRFMFASQSVY